MVQIKQLSRIINMLVERNMVLHTAVGNKCEITVVGDECVDYECSIVHFTELLTGIVAKSPRYENLCYAFLKEPGMGGTWCIVAKTNVEALKYVTEPVASQDEEESEEESEDEGNDEWDDESDADHIAFERSMPTPTEVKTANIILEAMRIREASYDKAAADEATVKADAEKAAEPDNIYAGRVDYNKFYTKTLEEACNEAAIAARNANMGELVFFTIYHAWNDASDWAKRIIKANDEQ